MRITVKGKNLQVTNALRQQAEKKLGKLDRYLGTDTVSVVTFGGKRPARGRGHYPSQRLYFTGEEATDDMYASIDLVVEKLEKQIEKYKTKLARKLRNQSLRDLVAKGRICPGRRGTQDPPDKTLPHQAYGRGRSHYADEYAGSQLLCFFQCGNGGSVNVLYRRKDGNYGLIEPEL